VYFLSRASLGGQAMVVILDELQPGTKAEPETTTTALEIASPGGVNTHYLQSGFALQHDKFTRNFPLASLLRAKA